MNTGYGVVLDVPKELVENCNGFALDFGGSVLKLVYVHKEDDRKLFQKQNTEHEFRKVRLVTLPASNEGLIECLKILRDNCHMKHNERSVPLMYTTGQGCQHHAKTIEKELNVKIDNLMEFDCFVEGFKYLAKHTTPKQFLYSMSEDASEIQDIQRRVQIWAHNLEKATEEGFTRMKTSDVNSLNWDTGNSSMSDTQIDQPIERALPNIYPCILLMFCSGIAFLMINPDGSSQILGITGVGGRMFLALGSLLCGTKKSYDDLVDMAEKGKSENIDDRLASVVSKSSQSKDDIYSRVLGDEDFYNDILYFFGQAYTLNPDSSQKEDLVRCLLNAITRLVVENTIQKAMLKKVRHIFVTGSFTNRHLIRTLLAKNLTIEKSRTGYFFNGQGLDCQMHFVKVGSHLGALGAMANNTIGFLGNS